jgi:tetratricopeptide (TPR) repeat protein
MNLDANLSMIKNASPNDARVLRALTRLQIRQTLSRIGLGDSRRPSLLVNLAALLYNDWEETGSVADYTAGNEALEEAIQISGPASLEFETYVDSLDYALGYQFKRTSAINDINTLVKARKKVVDALPQNHPSYTKYLHKYGRALLSRFQRIESQDDLAMSVKVLEQTLNLTPPDHDDLLQHIESLGHAISERNHDIDDANRLLELRLKVVELAPNDTVKAKTLSNLAGAYSNRYKFTSAIPDLNGTVDTIEKALRLLPREDYTRGRLLGNLGHALEMRFEQGRNWSDLDSAIIAFKNAAEAEDENDFLKSSFHHNISMALFLRFQITESTEDLVAAVNALEGTVNALPSDHPSKSRRTCDLGIAYCALARRTKSDVLLNAAIKAFNEGSDSKKDDFDNSKTAELVNLIGALMLKYRWHSAEDDFQAALKAGNAGLALSVKGSLVYRDVMANLASLYHEKFEKTRSLEDIEKVIEFRKDCMSCSSPSISLHSYVQGQYLKELGEALRDRFEITKSRDDLLEALERFSECLDCTETPATSRIKAAVQAGRLARSISSRKAFEFFAKATRLLPIASPRAARRLDQQSAIARCRSVGSDAAALCILCGEPFESALKLLELGRGVMIHTVLDVRGDLTELEVAHPELAERFKVARERCDTTVGQRRDTKEILKIATRYEPSKELDQVIGLIRDMEGFRTFLAGLSINDMRILCSDGPIVYVNASEFGSDAFIITQESVQHCRLPNLKFEELNDKEAKLGDALKRDILSTRKDTNLALRDILEWLWNVAVDPILKMLGFINVPQMEDPWPTVFWVPVGKLSLFPLHAAGYHDVVGQCTLDRVISSYTPTIRALQHAREKARRIDSIQDRKETLLLALMDKTPKQNSLPYATLEADNVDHVLPQSVDRNILKLPKKDELMERIQKASMVHYACHGKVDPIDPFSSTFLLGDWEVNPFSVEDMMSLKLDQARFAYLSACHGAKNESSLLDESIHMAGACLLAGFPTVIGTLWHVSDRYCASIAERVYRSMVKEDGTIEFRKSANGLHFALRDLKKSKVPPVLWTPFVHFGV